jgi:MoaA/NifB/PqqE/SkfB family radical SAM enzyme
MPFVRAAARMVLRRNKPLWKQLPLPVPLTVHLEPTNLCNFRCIFCPTGNRELLEKVKRPQGMMPLELFRSIIDQARTLTEKHGRRIKKLHLYKDGEPLLHKHFFEMASYAQRANVADHVSTTTNGSLLTDATVEKLVACKIDSIRISVEHVNDDDYRRIASTEITYSKILENVARLRRVRDERRSKLRIIAKTTDSGLPDSAKRQFFSDFTPIADEVRIDTLMGWSASDLADFTLGIPVDKGMDGVSPIVKNRNVCPEPFSNCAINFNGTASVCCVDWSHGTVVGDLTKQTLGEVWNGEALRAFRLKHLSGRRSEIAPCAQCQYLQGMEPSRDLDGKAAMLAERFS